MALLLSVQSLNPSELQSWPLLLRDSIAEQRHPGLFIPTCGSAIVDLDAPRLNRGATARGNGAGQRSGATAGWVIHPSIPD